MRQWKVLLFSPGKYVGERGGCFQITCQNVWQAATAREAKGGCSIALPIQPEGGALCQHELLAVIKAHTENGTVSYPISSLFPRGSRMSLSLTKVLDFRERLSCLSIYSLEAMERG